MTNRSFVHIIGEGWSPPVDGRVEWQQAAGGYGSQRTLTVVECTAEGDKPCAYCSWDVPSHVPLGNAVIELPGEKW